MATLPAPTGPYRIGTTTRHWVDPDRPDIFTGLAGGDRELMVQIWYPARPDSTGPGAPYVDDVRTLEQLALLMRLPRDAFAHLATLRTHAVRDAAVADDEPRYPVLLFSHGRCGVREHNTCQVEDLASHGYVVVTIDHPYAASGVRFPDDRLVEFDARLLPPWPRHARSDPEAAWSDSVIPYLAADVRFALRRTAALNEDPDEALAGRLDLDRVGGFGVSLGGVVVAEACVRESAFGAVLIMDGYVPADALTAGLRPPVMWLTRDATTMRREGWDEYDVTLAHDSMRTAFDGLPGDGYIVLVPGMYHIDFSDGRALSPLIAARGISGPFDGLRALEILRAYSLALFDRHLKGLPAPVLDAPLGPAADLSLERRRVAMPAAVEA